MTMTETGANIVVTRKCASCGGVFPNTPTFWYATGKHHQVLIHRSCPTHRARPVKTVAPSIAPITFRLLDRLCEIAGQGRNEVLRGLCTDALKRLGVDIEAEQRRSKLRAILEKLDDNDLETLQALMKGE